MNTLSGVAAFIVVGLFLMFVAERYGFLRPDHPTGFLSTRCAVPVSGTDAKGEWWGIGGIKYRIEAPRSPADKLCGDGKTAYWQDR